jgi:hypothetical protein
MKRTVLSLVLVLILAYPVSALDLFGYSITPKQAEKTEDEVAKEREKQIELFESLGVLKTTTQVDASGSAIIMMMTKDNTGVFTYQYVTTADTTNFEELLAQKGLIRPKVNKETGKVEKHIMVFNPKDRHTYVWVPLSQAREVAKRIKETGKTVPVKEVPRRLNTNDIRQMDFTTSF